MQPTYLELILANNLRLSCVGSEKCHLICLVVCLRIWLESLLLLRPLVAVARLPGRRCVLKRSSERAWLTSPTKRRPTRARAPPAAARLVDRACASSQAPRGQVTHARAQRNQDASARGRRSPGRRERPLAGDEMRRIRRRAGGRASQREPHAKAG